MIAHLLLSSFHKSFILRHRLPYSPDLRTGPSDESRATVAE